MFLPAESPGQRSLEGYRPWGSQSCISEVAQSCLTLCDPMDFSLPGSSIRGIFQARLLQWVAISFSRGSSRPRDQTQVSGIAGRRFTLWATREAQSYTGLSNQHFHFHYGGIRITASTIITTTTIMFQTSDLLQILTCINMNVTGS